MKCLGCGREIAWDGKTVFCYTCPCGATIFYDEKTGLHPPVSLILLVYEMRELPHIDYYLGKSSYTSPEKEEMYNYLRSKGCVWSWECEKCKTKVIARTVFEVASRLYPLELHPSLKEVIGEHFIPEGVYIK